MCSPRRTASYALGALVDVILNYFLMPPAPCLSRRTSSYALGALVDVLLNYLPLGALVELLPLLLYRWYCLRTILAVPNIMCSRLLQEATLSVRGLRIMCTSVHIPTAFCRT